ncbi:hypothetical protein CEP52_009996 [Fusarium oligoseptatum]|uniref:Uncharacterized protein n=1 Tax=Fusarium oligoseptatum TaxID=2604345 RepID=A0A428TAF3_9HYPO|nr:hypothetical protein CEP52_009996 [Fusarium oligoseptatum]
MRPIDNSDLNELLQRKPILMLDAIGLTINFIETLVRRSPSLITTNNGKKTLPLELWLEILEWTRLWRWPLLVQPQSLEEGSIDALVCASIPKWTRCGYLADDRGIKGPKPQRPFLLPHAPTEASIFKVPITALGQESKLLYGGLTVSDIMARVEDGKRFVCEGNGSICAGCGGGHEITKNFSFDWVCGDCSYQLLCPLCIGLGYAEKSLWVTDDRYEGEEGYLT